MGKTILKEFYLNLAKVEDAPGPRLQGWSRNKLLQTLDNAGDGVSSAFPKGKQNEEIIKKTIIPLSLFYN